MLTSIGLIIIGLILLVIGGEVLLRGAVGAATVFRLTPALIAITIVAAGTSFPELAVSATAALRGSSDIAVGNVVGSNLFNIAFIIGLTAIIRSLSVTGNTIRLEYPVLLLVTFLCVALCDDGAISRLDGLLFVSFYVAFTIYLVALVRKQMNRTEVEEFREEVQELAQTVNHPPRLWFAVGLIVTGCVILCLGANVLVMGAVKIARILGMSERVIGLTIVSGGTGMPEVVTSIISNIRGRDDVAIGNVIGSNLFNILGVLGLTALIAPIPVPQGTISFDNWWMLGVTLLLFPIMVNLRISRWEGALLLVCYGTYLFILLR